MKIVRLQVEHFGCVRSARLELGDGLNVLYGSNDLGKSTLAAAIRAVLLLQHSARAHEEHVEWTSDETPKVELVFQSEPRRFYRVRKTFGVGARGSSILESSRDGENFIPEVKGRGVDGQLRQLLRWGIPGPGKGASRKTESFLTTALLAQQDEVNAVFGKQLAEDPDETGKERLTQALQTLAQDPLVKETLLVAQEQVDRVYTPRGGKRKGRDSPLVEWAEKIRHEEEQVADLRAQSEQTKDLQESLARLRERRFDRHALAEDARTRVGRLELAERREEAAADLAKIDGKLRAVEDAETQEKELDRALREQIGRSEAAAAELEEALRQRDAAAEELRRLQSDEEGTRRLVEQQSLEKRQLEVRAARDDARRRADQARTAGEKLREIERLREELESAAGELETARRELTARELGAREAQAELERWNALERWLRRRDAVRELESLERKVESVEKLRREARAKDDEASSSREGLGADRWPSADEIVELRRLGDDVRLAEARLEVGLSVDIKPRRQLDLRFASDGEEMQATTLSLQTTLEAERKLKLEIGDLVDLVVKAGTPEMREEIEAVRSRWESRARPWLQRVGVATVDELDLACRAAEERARKAAELERAASGLRAQAEALGDPGDRSEELRRRLEELGGDEGEDWAEESRSLGVGDLAELERRRDDTRRRLDEAREARQERRVEIAGKETRLQGSQDDLSARHAASEEALRELGADWEEALAAAEKELRRLDGESADVGAKLESLTGESSGVAAGAEERRRDAEDRSVAAKEAKEEVEKEADRLRQELGRVRGELAVRREQAEGLDREGARQEIAAIDAELTSAGDGAEGGLEEARRRLEQAEAALQDVEVRIREEEGALRQVGGDVVQEQLERAEDVLEQRREREADLELDFDAWRLLLETVQEAENEQASHLGQALIGPVSERFSELTGGRYGKLQLGPNLETQGIVAAGSRHDVNVLSVGTREQLSTLFRVCLARQIESVVLLDDQLVQSDVEKMTWFRKFLDESAEDVQILVLTSRPEDYLSDSQRPAEGKALHDSRDGRLRAVDLERLVLRAS